MKTSTSALSSSASPLSFLSTDHQETNNHLKRNDDHHSGEIIDEQQAKRQQEEKCESINFVPLFTISTEHCPNYWKNHPKQKHIMTIRVMQ
jgi:hypothetical protein